VSSRGSLRQIAVEIVHPILQGDDLMNVMEKITFRERF
jgi:hypothetical protein